MKPWQIGRLFRKSLPADHHIRQGNAHNSDRNWAQAARSYQAALSVDSGLAYIWIQLGHAFKEQGDLSQAEHAYRQATLLSPHDPDGWFQLGHLLSLAGNFRDSITALEEGQRISGDPLFAAEDIVALRERQKQPTRSWKQPEWVTPDITGLWTSEGFCHAGLELFDPWAYWQINPEVRQTFAAPVALELVRHFCTSGVSKCLPFSLVESFNPDFYRRFRLNNIAFTDAGAYRHWLTTGIAQHLPANEKRWIQSLLGDRITTLEDVDPLLSSAFRDENAPNHTRRTLVEGFISDLLTDSERPVTPTPRNAPFLHAIACRGEKGDQQHQVGARMLREKIYFHVPTYRENTRALARTMIDYNLDIAAFPLLKNLAGHPDEPAQTLLALAECENRLGSLDNAVTTLRTATKKKPGRPDLRVCRNIQEDRNYHHAWNTALALARTNQIKAGQSYLRAFLDGLPFTLPDHTPLRARSGAVAILGKLNLPQCRLYRVEQRRDQLLAAGYTVEIFDVDTDLDVFTAKIAAFESVIFYRLPAWPVIIRAIHLVRSLGLTTFYDIDDPIFDAELYPEPFETYGGTISQEAYYGLALGAPLFAKALSLCEYAIASTEPLAERMRHHYNGEVFVQPNGLGEAHAIAMRRHGRKSPSPDQPVTIFYGSNTKANRSEIVSVLEPALARTLKKYGQRVRLCIVGDLPEDSVLTDLKGNITLLAPLPDVQAYWSLLSSADINLAILGQSPTTDTKSGIKWLEAAMFGIPSILSDTAGYRDVAKENETALFATDTNSWVRALDQLVADQALRIRIGKAAYTYALTTYGATPLASRAKVLMERTAPPDTTTRHRILGVNVFYPPQAIGGATRVFHDNLSDLSAPEDKRFLFEVFTSQAEPDSEELRVYAQDGILVTSVAPLDVDDKDRIAEDPNMVTQFRKVIERFRPNLVHLHCIQRLTAGIIDVLLELDIPYCITLHDAWWISDRQFVIDELGQQRLYNYSSPLETLERCGANAVTRMESLRDRLFGAKAVLGVSEAFTELYRTAGVYHVQTIENGVSALTPRPRLREESGRIRLGFIGGLARHKGWDLIQIALRGESFHNLELLAIDHAMSPGDERTDVFGQTPVVFRGKMSQNEVADLYANIDVLLAPSIWPESFGLVTREAALCGCWVVASDRGAIGAIISNNINGFRIDVSNAADLCRVLMLIDKSPTRFRQPAPELKIPRTARDQAQDLGVLYQKLLQPGES
ncbi:glycosyltransferase [Gluconobacter wancherniae]|uniref:glycosyltransferase n=1 Tax=Gluconobacter wancherniae TaxID=1307955 RepID=UPI001B8D8C5F|nr:glycosyltransferase [Gluconobacter wancherniae]MBS1089843.1 glycosyltransferase [Gluconobacter wancherniae]